MLSFDRIIRYFQSRPHLQGGRAGVGAGGGAGGASVEAVAIAAAPAVYRAAAKNPQAAASLVTTGAKTWNKWNQNPNNGGSVSDMSLFRLFVFLSLPDPIGFCRPIPPKSIAVVAGVHRLLSVV